MMRLTLGVVLGVLLMAWPVSAQTVTFAYDAPTPSVAVAQGWAPTLYVNNQAFPVAAHTCTLAGAIVTCTFTAPNFAAALTAQGPQTFEVSLRDAVVGEGPRSLPLSRTRPAAPTNLRPGSAP